MGFLDLRICVYYNYYTHILQNYTVQIFLASLMCLKISFHRFNQNGSKFEAIQASAGSGRESSRSDQAAKADCEGPQFLFRFFHFSFSMRSQALCLHAEGILAALYTNGLKSKA